MHVQLAGIKMARNFEELLRGFSFVDPDAWPSAFSPTSSSSIGVFAKMMWNLSTTALGPASGGEDTRSASGACKEYDEQEEERLGDADRESHGGKVHDGRADSESELLHAKGAMWEKRVSARSSISYAVVPRPLPPGAPAMYSPRWRRIFSEKLIS